MKVSRCLCLQLLGLLVVVEGVEEYSLAGGTLYLGYTGGCSSAWTKLWLQMDVRDVKGYAKSKGVEIPEDETKPGLSMYGTDEKGFYAQNETTAMYFNGADNEMRLFTTDVLRDDEFTSRVTKLHGEFILQAGENMHMMQNLPGWSVCIDDPNVIKKFKEENPVKASWAKKFKHFFMKDKILGLRQKDDGICVDVAEGKCAFPPDLTFELWFRDDYFSNDGHFSIGFSDVRGCQFFIIGYYIKWPFCVGTLWHNVQRGG
eukprot:GHVS01023620.1.p1 GENE.GHVS01023620.1~~GHVS01023620.1.p1  ORF type:complete len:259 (+),score=21.41 GHVS01023620.1:70-846(+)